MNPLEANDDDMAKSWVLAIDFGTSSTVAATRIGDGPAEVIEVDGERRVPSVVMVVDDGSLLVGRPADQVSTTNPGQVLRAPKARLGDPTPVVLDGRPRSIVELVGAVLEHVYDEALRYHGAPPDSVRLTHPATWSGPKREQLAAAATVAGLADPILIPEPVAAAIAYADEQSIGPGDHVVVYDLGGGTFDTAVLRAADDGFVIVGRPTGDSRLGGELFDELLANSIGERLDPEVFEQLQLADDPAWRRAATALRSETQRVREALSFHEQTEFVLGLPDGLVQQRVERTELERIIGPYVDETIDVTSQTVAGAGLRNDEVAAVYLVGGASRTPLVAERVRRAFPTVPVSLRGDPKAVVAVGATHPQATPTSAALRRSLDQPVGRTTVRRDTSPDDVGDGSTGAVVDGSVLAASERDGRSAAPNRRWLAAAAAGLLVVGAGIGLATVFDGEPEAGPITEPTTSQEQIVPRLTVPAGTDAVTTVPATTTTTAGTTTTVGTTTAPPDTGPPETTTAVPATDGDLQSALLTPEDLLAPGWERVADLELEAVCGENQALQRARSNATIAYERIEEDVLVGRQMVHTIYTYGTASDAAAAVQRDMQILDACLGVPIEIGGQQYSSFGSFGMLTERITGDFLCNDESWLGTVLISDPTATAAVPQLWSSGTYIRCGVNVTVLTFTTNAGPEDLIFDEDYLNATEIVASRLAAVPGSV